MITKSRNLLPACLFALALSALVSMPKTCVAQITDAAHSATLTPPPSRASGSTAPVQQTEAGAADPAAPQSTPQSSSPQSGIAGLAGRVKVFNRNGPTRESWTTIDLGTKYAKAVVGGFEQGASLGFGLQLTTADLFRFVEFRATALTSPNLYRRFEGEAYFPRVFDKNTHADVWFDSQAHQRQLLRHRASYTEYLADKL